MATPAVLVSVSLLALLSPACSQITETNVRQYLYTEIEGALLSNPLTLLQLRDLLIKDDVPLTVGFTAILMANNITNPSNCTPVTKENTPAFIKNPEMGIWELPAPLNNFWTPFIQPNSLAEDQDLLNFAASLYGTVTYWVVALTVVPQDEFPDMDVSTTSIILDIPSLSCNPGVVDVQFATCGVFSWVGVRGSWDEPERAPPSRLYSCAVYTYIHVYIVVRTSFRKCSMSRFMRVMLFRKRPTYPFM